MSGIQKADPLAQSTFLFNLSKELTVEFNQLLDLEEELWALRSRVDWMFLGDRNTSFFHISTLANKRRSIITSLRDNVGNWISDPLTIEKLINDFFINLFSTSHMSNPSVFPPSPFSLPSLCEADRNHLDWIPSILDIKEALFSLKPYKSPGPDGFHPIFFQKCWNITHEDIVHMVQDVFRNKCVDPRLNVTHICLIPKVDFPDSVSQFRPISLCNTLYKIITKIIVNRIRPLLPAIISPLQGSFIPGRNATDSVLVVQEIVHALSKRKGMKGHFAIKVDLEKAYDRI